MTQAGESAGRTGTGGRRGLLLLLAIVVGLHSAILWRAPERQLFGDEFGYLERARMDASAGRTSLLPGTLRFHWRPELASRRETGKSSDF